MHRFILKDQYLQMAHSFKYKTEMTEDRFYVGLPCNASLSIYMNNTVSNYRTYLANALRLNGRWEVGVVEFEYPRTWYTFNDEVAFF